MKIDKRVNYLIGIDTETCNGNTVNEKLDLSDSIVYDIGWIITDKRGHIYERRSFVIYEIFIGMKDVMRSAYYAEKIPSYWKEIKAGDRQLISFYKMREIFLNDLTFYNIKTAFAHNARFDITALNNTIRWITKSKKRYFFPYGTVEIWDTLKIARQTYGREKGYRNFCEQNGFMTKHKTPQVRLTAEILFKYISGNYSFIENHTGMEDVLIETEILTACLRKHRKIEKKIF